MKRINVFFTLIIILLGCKDKSKIEQSFGIEIINPDALTQELFAEQREAASVVFVTTGGAWTSTITEGSASWIEFDPANGDIPGRYTIYIGMKANTTGDDRTAVITLRCGNTERDIAITQKSVDSNGNPYEEPDGPPKIVVVNSAALNQELFADQRTATSVVFNTSEAWTSAIAEDAETWIELNPEKGDASGRYTLSISLKPNDTGEDRTAVITVNCGGEELNITITQKAVGSGGSDNETIEEYLNKDWELLQRAREQALAEDRTPLSPRAIHKILFVACTSASLNGTSYIMDEPQKQFFRDVAQNFKEVVELWSNNNVVVETDFLYIDREVVMPAASPRWVIQSDIQAELDIYAPAGKYDGILVTAERNIPGVHLGVKTAGYENLYGYAWFQLRIPTGSQAPPVSFSYVMPKADEAPFLSTNVAVHEWMHKLEFLGGALNPGGILDIIFPAVHAYSGSQTEFPGYTQYVGHPVWDYAAYYRDYLSGEVPFSSGGVTRKIGMYPLMWRITPRFLNSNAVYIVNESNGLYLTYSGDITTYSSTPSPWYLRYNGKFNGDDRYLILTPGNRSLDIRNASNSEGNAVGIFGVNGGYPQAQNFRISKNSDGTYKLTTTFPSNNRVLQRNTGTTYSTGTTINTDNGNANQKWRFIDKP